MGPGLFVGSGDSRIVSLYELMLYMPVAVLYELSALFTQTEFECRNALEVMGAEVHAAIIKPEKAQVWRRVFQSAKAQPQFARALPFSMGTIERIDNALSEPTTTLWHFGELVRDLNRRFADELGKQIHFQIDPWAADLVRAPLGEWEPAIAKFASIERDVSEASWCLALHRSTASVFHLMRVLEFGLDNMRRMVRVARRRPGWDGLIIEIDKKLAGKVGGKKKSQAIRKRDRFLADAVMLLRAVKEARNTTMHDYTKTYTPRQAHEVYTAVRSFMLKMAEVA
jgi:hypothetical protein